MTRTYCDVCNKETSSVAEYMLPKRMPRYATDKAGNKIMPFGETVEPVKKELCPRCAHLLNVFIDSYLAALSTEDDKYTIQFNLIHERE